MHQYRWPRPRHRIKGTLPPWIALATEHKGLETKGPVTRFVQCRMWPSGVCCCEGPAEGCRGLLGLGHTFLLSFFLPLRTSPLHFGTLFFSFCALLTWSWLRSFNCWLPKKIPDGTIPAFSAFLGVGSSTRQWRPWLLGFCCPLQVGAAVLVSKQTEINRNCYLR